MPYPLSYTPLFCLRSRMAESLDPDFAISLAIALRLVRQQTRVDYGARHPHARDAAADTIAALVIEQLRRSGWEISHPATSIHVHGESKSKREGVI